MWDTYAKDPKKDALSKDETREFVRACHLEHCPEDDDFFKDAFAEIFSSFRHDANGCIAREEMENYVRGIVGL